MDVCFVGHKTIEKTEELISSLKETVVTLINKGANTFLFGRMSEFDELAWETVTQIKKEYPLIKRVYVRASYQHIDNSYEKHLLNFYEQTYFPPKIQNAGKYSYVERNYEMIDRADCCVFYYNKDYVLPPQRRSSGTKIAYQYAKRKKKEIINLYK